MQRKSLRSVALGRIYLRCLEKNFMNEFPTQKQENVSMNIKCPQRVFEERSPHVRPTSIFQMFTNGDT